MKFNKINQLRRRQPQTKRFAYFGLAMLIIFSVLSYSFFLKPASKVKAGTKINDASNFGYLDNAKHTIVRTSGGTIYSFVRVDGTGKCEMWKSSNGSSWAQQNSVATTLCEKPAAAIDGSGVIHLLYQGSGPSAANLVYRTFSTSTDTYGSEEVLVGYDDNLNGLDIAVDSNNKPHIISGGYTFDGSGYYEDVFYSNKVSGTWAGATPTYTLGATNTTWLSSQSIAINEDNIPEIAFTDSTSPRVAVGNANSATSFTNKNIVGAAIDIVIDSSGNTWVSYTNTTLTLIKHNDNDSWSTWQSPVAHSSAVTGHIAANGSNIYLFYSSSPNTYYDRYNGSWLGATTIETLVSTILVKWSYWHNNGGSIQIDYLYSDGTDVYWNKLDLTSTPAAPTLSLPNSGATGQSTTPTFEFRTTDGDNDYLQYEIIVYQSDCSTVVRTIDQSSSQTGWTGQDAQTGTAYVGNTVITSSTMASHTYQTSALTNSTTYCWKARAKDPGGTNTFGSYSATQNFTTGVNTSPAAPTLISPASGATGVSISPLLQFRTTDADNDYLKYKIIIYDSDCSSNAQTFDQTSSQTGWSGQDAQTGSAYVGNSVLSSSTISVFGGASLSTNTQYCWKAAAIDPGGTNTFGSYSSTQLFTTGAASGQVNINGNTLIRGGTIIR